MATINRFHSFGWIRIVVSALAILAVVAVSSPVLAKSMEKTEQPVGNAPIAPQDSSSTPWVTTGPLTTGRMEAQAVLLDNGLVLAAGGTDSNFSVALASAELYNPVTGTWTPTGSLITGRFGFAMTKLADGKVLVVEGVRISGNNYVPVTQAEIYNPSSGTWSNAGTMSTGLARGTATLLQNGNVLVAGGAVQSGSTLNGSTLAFLFDPEENSFTSAASMHFGRMNHSATALSDGRVLVVGGASTAGSSMPAITSVEVYDPTENTWTTLNPLSQARHSHTATLLDDSRVLVVGGSSNGTTALTSVELYDPTGGSWSAAASLTTGRYSHTAAKLGNGDVLIAGGSDASQNALSSAELYTPAAGGSGSWSVVGTAMSAARVLHAAVAINASQILEIGGSNNTTVALTSCEIFDTRQVIGIQLGSLNQTYDGTPKSVTISTTPTGSEGLVQVTYAGSVTPPTHAGSYAVRAVIDTDDYFGLALGTLVVNKKAASVTAGSAAKTYGVSDPALPTSNNGFIAGDLGTGKITFSTSRVAGENVGTYTITPLASDNGSGLLGNYTVTYTTGTLTVNKRNVSVTAEAKTKVYGNSDPSLTYAITSGSLVGSDVFSGALSRETGENVGGYAILQNTLTLGTNYNLSYTGASLTITRATAAIPSLGGLSQVYDGTARVVTAVTDPVGVMTTIKYDGSVAAPIDAGSYSVTVDITDPNYSGSSASGTLVVAKASAGITLTPASLTQTYDGGPRVVTVTTAPAGKTVDLTYTGISSVYGPSSAAPVNSGTYRVDAVVNDPNYQGTASGTLSIAKATAEIALSNLGQVYDGTRRAVTVTTLPAGLTYTVQYEGTDINGGTYGPVSEAPINAGSYQVTVSIIDVNYQGSATGTLNVTPVGSAVYYIFLPTLVR